MFNSIQTFEGKSLLRTWIFGVAFRQLLSERRKNKRKKRSELSFEDVFAIEGAHKGEICEISLEDLEIDALKREILDRALNLLPGNKAIVVRLHLGERNNEEIAKELEKKKSTVASLLCQGLEQLRSLVRFRLSSDEFQDLAEPGMQHNITQSAPSTPSSRVPHPEGQT